MSQVSYTKDEFKAMTIRLEPFIGGRTQTHLANALGIRQSSVADARRRCDGPPASWLLALWRKHNLNPDWVLYGTGERFLVPANNSPRIVKVDDRLEYLTLEELMELLQRKLGSKANINISYDKSTQEAN